MRRIVTFAMMAALLASAPVAAQQPANTLTANPITETVKGFSFYQVAKYMRIMGMVPPSALPK